ncbi:MAG TPA: pilus assembly protein TadG-related protein [Candidatus Dormibacteraeota bacterium]|nr:pilus assembly protein TadG-related protein [Candidatus Dormibacteraeota bacterium]
MLNTAARSTRPNLQQGQAIVLIALLILVMFGMLGLAIDSGRAYVDRRDQQAAVDAAALASGDWFENFNDLSHALNGVQVYENDLRLYGATPAPAHQGPNFVGPYGVQQDIYTYTWPQGYTLTVTATNTTVNGYEFEFDTAHQLPLAFMQIFGGAKAIPITASATAIVNNQRQTPALLTLSTAKCATDLTGSAQLTVLGDVYTNGIACLDSNLHEAGNCYGAAGSNCSIAQYYCYNGSAGFVPYDPATTGGSCKQGDTLGSAIVPAPTLPDPGYLAGAATTDCGGGSCYPNSQSYNQWNRGTWTEMLPGQYDTFHLSGGSASCAFLDPGVYTWTNGYSSDATGSMLSNELRPPDEPLYSDKTNTALANPQFWNQNGTNCWGQFNIQPVTLTSGLGIKHQGGGGQWGVELTSIRYDRFTDGAVSPNPCNSLAGCRRESAPSACQQVGTLDGNNQGIAVNITQNAPGAQYYGVYIDPLGCPDGVTNFQTNFGFWGRFVAPGYVGLNPPATAVGPWPSGSNNLLPGPNGQAGWTCTAPTATVCQISYTQLTGTYNCYSQTHAPLCTPPDLELAPQCFSNCPPPANLLSQENAAMSLEYPPYTGGDLANENYCQPPPNPGDPNAPCQGSEVTPGGVQFYFPNGSCFSQNAQGATYVYAGLQYNWIVIYAPASNTCNESLNGGASTQYIGTIYTPGANWTINGSDRSPLAGQVICYTATVSGGGQAGIDFNPNYSPAPPAARLIN